MCFLNDRAALGIIPASFSSTAVTSGALTTTVLYRQRGYSLLEACTPEASFPASLPGKCRLNLCSRTVKLAPDASLLHSFDENNREGTPLYSSLTVLLVFINWKRKSSDKRICHITVQTASTNLHSFQVLHENIHFPTPLPLWQVSKCLYLIRYCLVILKFSIFYRTLKK